MHGWRQQLVAGREARPAASEDNEGSSGRCQEQVGRPTVSVCQPISWVSHAQPQSLGLNPEYQALGGGANDWRFRLEAWDSRLGAKDSDLDLGSGKLYIPGKRDLDSRLYVTVLFKEFLPSVKINGTHLF